MYTEAVAKDVYAAKQLNFSDNTFPKTIVDVFHNKSNIQAALGDSGGSRTLLSAPTSLRFAALTVTPLFQPPRGARAAPLFIALGNSQMTKNPLC